MALAAVGAWVYVKTIGKTTSKTLIDPKTNRPVVIEKRHSVFFIPVKAWAWIISCVAGLGIVGVALDPQGFEPDRRTAEEKEADAAALSGEEALQAAERLISAKGDGAAHGNTPEARELARRFSAQMAILRDAGIEKQKRKSFSLTGGQFLTYCRISDQKVAFVTHVPGLRKFTDDAKQFIAEAGWLTAQQCALQLDPQPGSVTVGLRGIVNYDAVLTGSLSGSPQQHAGAQASEVLADFFGSAPATPPRLLDKPASAGETPSLSEALAASEDASEAFDEEKPAAEIPEWRAERVWRDASGREMKATFVRHTEADGSKAEFRRADNQVFIIQTSTLSEEDQTLLKAALEHASEEAQ